MHIPDFDSIVHIKQVFYMSKIEQISSDGESSKFASMRMKRAWVANTRPDIVFRISQISQVTLYMYEKDIIKPFKRLNKVVKYVYDHRASICIA